jgi:hypothetical protein
MSQNSGPLTADSPEIQLNLGKMDERQVIPVSAANFIQG